MQSDFKILQERREATQELGWSVKQEEIWTWMSRRVARLAGKAGLKWEQGRWVYSHYDTSVPTDLNRYRALEFR